MLYTFTITIFLVVLLWHLNRRFSLRYRLTVAIFGTQRERNQKHCYDFPSENNGWKKIGNAPVYGNQSTGTIFDPYVYLEADTFVMCASERATGSLIALHSTDGKQWEKISTMLTGVPGTWQNIVNRGSVLKHNGIYMMWYTGQQDGMSAIGLAISKDGLTYTPVQPDPVLTPTSTFEGKSVMNPCVLWSEEKQLFQMWYSAGEAYEPDVICYAESRDGIGWEKYDTPVLSKYPSHEWEKAKVGGCSVIKEKDGSYHIFYIGYQNLDVARICEAYSEDGIKWTRPDNNLLISPSKGSWDANATYKPTVVIRDDRTYLWYNGRNAIDEFIGLTTK